MERTEYSGAPTAVIEATAPAKTHAPSDAPSPMDALKKRLDEYIAEKNGEGVTYGIDDAMKVLAYSTEIKAAKASLRTRFLAQGVRDMRSISANESQFRATILEDFSQRQAAVLQQQQEIDDYLETAPDEGTTPDLTQLNIRLKRLVAEKGLTLDSQHMLDLFEKGLNPPLRGIVRERFVELGAGNKKDYKVAAPIALFRQVAEEILAGELGDIHIPWAARNIDRNSAEDSPSIPPEDNSKSDDDTDSQYPEFSSSTILPYGEEVTLDNNHIPQRSRYSRYAPIVDTEEDEYLFGDLANSSLPVTHEKVILSGVAQFSDADKKRKVDLRSRIRAVGIWRATHGKSLESMSEEDRIASFLEFLKHYDKK
ncbi:MAG TPA: hypothetical protein VG965_02275 [Patescibacteria group bacterium]|nr:hypothetical protein [Patescibacteria group bacterium]